MINRQALSNRLVRSSGARVTATIALIAGTAVAAVAQQVDIPAWRQGTEYRAMKLQRELAADMRQDQSLLLGSHNSYNSSAYGLAVYPNSQHSYSLWEQLDLGLRSLDLDVHASIVYPNELWLSHTTCAGGNLSTAQNTVWDGLYEIRQWLNNNPDEVITLNFEQHFPMANPGQWHSILEAWVEEHLGGADPSNGPDVLIRPREIASLLIPSNPQLAGATNIAHKSISMSLTELRELGRVLIVNTGGTTEPCNNHYMQDYPFQNYMLGDLPGWNWCGSDLWEYVYAKVFAQNPIMHYWGGNDAGGTTRSSCNESIYSVLYNNTSAGQYDDYGSEPPEVVREAVRAGMDYIRFDPVGKSLGIPGSPIEFDAAEQMRATIWSWDHRYPPPVDNQPRAAMAVVQGDTARIRWASPEDTMRYALQDRNGAWSISSSSGTFAAAPPEIPDSSTSTNFRVPGNAFEMQNLFGEMIRTGVTQVWINYHDLDGDGVWTHATQNRSFQGSGAFPPLSPVPTLVSNGSALAGTLTEWRAVLPHPSGRVLGILPGSYPAGSGGFRFSSACTIVPAEHGHPVAIGRP